MEANPTSSNAMENGTDNHPPQSPFIDLVPFISELCKITGIPITGNNILERRVGENILAVVKNWRAERQSAGLVVKSAQTQPNNEVVADSASDEIPGPPPIMPFCNNVSVPINPPSSSKVTEITSTPHHPSSSHSSSTPAVTNCNSNGPTSAMASQNGGDNTDKNGTPAPALSPELPVEAQKQHGVLSKSRGNFLCKCDVTSKFKNLAHLKLHIRQQVEPWRFKCQPCNVLFFYKSAMEQHRKTKVCKQMSAKCIAVQKGISVQTKSALNFKVFSSRSSGMASILPTYSPRHPAKSPRHPVMAPRHRRIVPGHPEMSSRRSGMSQKHLGMVPRHPATSLSQLVIPYIDPKYSRWPFNQHSDDTHSFPQLDEMTQSTGIMNVNQRENDDSFGLNGRPTRWRDHEWYGCFVCEQSFRLLSELTDHLLESHNTGRRKVRCGMCGKEFGSCNTFHKHREQAHSNLIAN